MMMNLQRRAFEQAVGRFRRFDFDTQAAATEQEVEGEPLQGFWQPWSEEERAVLHPQPTETCDQRRPGPRK